jgi:erythromycin esterase-like protein
MNFKAAFGIFLFLIFSCSDKDQKIENAGGSIEDYSYLDTLVNGKKIVFLGEPTHGDGTIFSNRIEIIKYLNENHGFNAVVFESNIYDAALTNELRKRETIKKEDYEQATFAIWGKTNELQVFWDFLLENKTFDFLGMDHYPHILMKMNFLEDLKQVIELSKVEENLIQSMLDTIATTELLPRKYFLNEESLDVLAQLKERVENPSNPSRLKDGLENLIHYAAFESIDRLNDQFWTKLNFRDSLMFESLVRHVASHDKVIVWLASAHGLESPSDVIDPDDLKEMGQTYSDMVTLGKLARSHFGNEMLNLAFSAYRGSFHDYVDKAEVDFALDSIPNLEKNTIEKAKTTAYVDLRKIDSVFFSGILGFQLIEANWGKNFDGVIIFPEVKASTMKE